jgi:mycobactin phenyloxazoline synthetase
VSDATLTRDGLVETIARVAEVSPEDIQDGTDLIALGLDSLSFMRLVNELRVHGLPVTYQDLADQPTVGAWWARISHVLATNPYLAA